MKKSIVLLLLCFVCLPLFGQTSQTADIAIVPVPVKLTKTSGRFTLPENVIITAPKNDRLSHALAFLSRRLSVPTGSRVKTVTHSSPNATIQLTLNETRNKTIGDEGYQLSVTPGKITISANKPAGLFYGIQSLIQLFPPQIESDTAVTNVEWSIPAVKITDYPRFGWRGLMLDVARHFFTVDEGKEFIDQMVRYKYNLLHLHLTDDQGWRIEIKGLPKLTEIGAWRVKKVGYFGTFSPPEPNAPRNYGGFYTQDEIRELVKYAKKRFVDILPEVDVPSHSLAAIAAYPELSCTPGADEYEVNSGEKFMDWSHGAPPLALVDNTLCPANEKVYTFLDKVIGQIATLFPFEYIHMGGDEAPHNFWKKSPQIKALMERKGLETMNEVQSYFTHRVAKIVESKGKKLIGWDEIMMGGNLPSDAAVMSWRGMEGGIEAAQKGHKVVMSPTDYAYLDYMQGDPIIEPHVYSTLRLSKAYQFDPLPDGVNPKYILGGQGNLWTEQIYNMRHLEYMLWPRGMAISEALWSPESKRDWSDFFHRVEQQFKRLDVQDIKYAPSVYDPIFNVSWTDNHQLKIKLTTEVKSLDIYYSFDNSYPDKFYPKYTHPLVPPEDAVMLRVITYEGEEPAGRMISMPIKKLKKRADEKI